MKVLVVRYGGIGDSVILTPVLKQLSKKFKVHFAVPEKQTTLFRNLNFIEKIIPLYRIQGSGEDFFRIKNGLGTIARIKPDYDLVLDYRFSIEGNSMYRQLAEYDKPLYGDWLSHQNSNYQNWIDISLGWANIDPQTVTDDEKRPIYKPEQKEIEWAKATIGDNKGRVIGIQLYASSLCRSFYHPQELPKKILELKDTGINSVFIFDGESWHKMIKLGNKKIVLPKWIDPYRASAALISQFDRFVTADTGMSHIAEAVGTDSIVIYTTVPAWTRQKYYKHNTPIQANVKCSPCFTLGYSCPLNKARAIKQLSKREQFVKKYSDEGISLQEAAQKLNTTTDGLQQEFNSINQKIEALSKIEPDCVKDITADKILGFILYDK